MKTLEDLKNIDDRIFKEFQRATDLYLKKLLKSEFRSTTELCYLYISSANSIKNSIFDCIETDDYYSVSILFRSIIEHYLRFKYFWFKSSGFNSDSYSTKFLMAIDFKEKIEIERSLNVIKNLNKMNTKTEIDIWNDLVAENPNFTKFSKQEISEFSASLSIKNIIRFIEGKMKDDKNESNIFLQKLIFSYSNLSSFVHGGIFANRQMNSLQNDNERHRSLIGISGIALQSATFIKLFSFLTFYQFMPEFGEHYNNISQLSKEIIN